MPMLIEHLDAIARQKQRDVLYVVFHHPASDNEDREETLVYRCRPKEPRDLSRTEFTLADWQHSARQIHAQAPDLVGSVRSKAQEPAQAHLQP